MTLVEIETSPRREWTTAERMHVILSPTIAFVEEVSLLPFPMRVWCHDLPGNTHPMWGGYGCDVYWGSHGCDLIRGHDGPCVCDCAWEWEDGYVREGYAPREDSEGVRNVGAPPYYGPDTAFYGDDAAALGLPLGEDR